MKQVITAVCVAGLLAGCSEFRAKVDVFATANLPTLCVLADEVAIAYNVVLGSGEVPTRVQSVWNQAWAVKTSICNNPAAVNSTTALREAAEAYAALKNAQRDAELAAGD